MKSKKNVLSMEMLSCGDEDTDAFVFFQIKLLLTKAKSN